MQWPDTTAVRADAAGFEAGSASQATAQHVRPTVSGVRPASSRPGMSVTGQARITRVAGRLDLPCREDPELFFAEAPADVEAAKALCRECPVMIACFNGALERREPWGVWGGELFLRGQVVPRKRPRGRPRKDEVAA
jgi:WhiB family transcriptional regulator, redox-sensing transcriptional regulator